MLRVLSLAQGFYFIVTGLWPLISIRTFQMITGRKTDLWLVKTVGVLITVTGSALVMAGLRAQITPEVLLIAVGSAASLASIDIVYVAKGVILPVYLLDAVIELGFTVGWLLALVILAEG